MVKSQKRLKVMWNLRIRTDEMSNQAEQAHEDSQSKLQMSQLPMVLMCLRHGLPSSVGWPQSYQCLSAGTAGVYHYICFSIMHLKIICISILKSINVKTANVYLIIWVWNQFQWYKSSFSGPDTLGTVVLDVVLRWTFSFVANNVGSWVSIC